ncbi:hypothetical protein BDV25DRAFT_6130 [Aspergillus avenaceus]|uniref:Ankyrin repeat-containing domain protein n=1 Tax=Aspergillus avenaceus TaxID=36643 RepID=A0A5N6U631_ASPAV|nr:hypothetical protein BDV25DRAFT_6130 [Aspergillus avenaceus]
MVFCSLVLIITCIAPTVWASGWDDFTDNLATDLAPLISLFGERLTTQFLSESISLLDNLIFAFAPLGILTAVVSAIRVCGNASLKAFIGRAQEGPGEAEHELLSCVSETTAELFNNGGISRVFGRPRILEVVVWKDQDPVSNETCWRIGTLRDALQQDAWVGSEALDEKGYLPELDIPNLSLNKGIKRRSQFWFYLAAVVAFLLQTGVIVYSAITVFIFPGSFQKDDQPVESYAFPLFIFGTIFLCTGMFLCAFMIERSSREYHFRPTKPSKICWLQPGGQNVGDQAFGAFLGINEGSDSQLTDNLMYVKSIRDRNLEGNWPMLILGIFFTLVGFVAQFVGLRGLHSSVTLAQMGSTFVMAIVRTCLRTKRISPDENRIAKQEQQIASHKSQELDFFAFHLEETKSFNLVTGLVRGSSVHQPSLSSTSSGISGKTTRPGAKLIQTRAQLARLTSHVGQSHCKAWDDLPIRQVAHDLSHVIIRTMDLLSTWKDVSKDVDSFELDFVCQSHQKFVAPELEHYAIHLERSDDTLQWRVREEEIEAVLGLWTWSLLSSDPDWLRNGLCRLVGMSESEARHEDTDLYFHKWIFRQREATMVSSKAICLPQRMFGYVSDELPLDKEIMVVRSDNCLEFMAAQDIYIQFMKSVMGHFKELGGDVDVRRGSQNGYYAHSSHLDDLVSCFEMGQLGSREDALLCIVPVLRHRGLLPRLAGDSHIIKLHIEELIAASNWSDAFSLLWWLSERCEGEEFDHSIFELGYVCRCAMLHADSGVQAEGYRNAYQAIECDPRTRLTGSLRSGRPTGWMQTDKRPENWIGFSFQLGWAAWHISQKNSDRQSIQDILRSFGINEYSVSLAKANGSEDQGKKGEQAALHWLTNNDEKLYNRELLSTDDRLALDWLCQNRHYALLDWLIARWVELETRCPGFVYHILTWAIEGQYRAAIDALHRHGVSLDIQNPKDGSTLLMDKIMEDDRKAIHELIDAGADVNGRHLGGATPLSAASHKGDLETVSLLLRRGARVNIQDRDGFSPLICSIVGNHVDVARTLFDHGADANLGSFGGSTPLMTAAADDRVEIMELLLSRGAEVDVESSDGCTALMLAARNGCTEATRLLLNHGADVYKRMLGGTTALDWAREVDHATGDCIQLLESAMAQRST